MNENSYKRYLLAEKQEKEPTGQYENIINLERSNTKDLITILFTIVFYKVFSRIINFYKKDFTLIHYQFIMTNASSKAPPRTVIVKGSLPTNCLYMKTKIEKTISPI